MTSLPKIRAQYGEGIGVELFFQAPDLSSEENSYLDADSIAGALTLSASGVNFSVGQYILLGNFGAEKSEILQIHASTTPTATLITLASGAQFPHNRGDRITFMPENQIVAENSTDGVSFNTLSAINIRPDASETYLQRTADLSTYSYRFRFYNSALNLYSAYSDVTSAAGYADNTVWSVKNRALSQIGEEIGDLITSDFLDGCIMEARRWCDQNPAILRWSFRQLFGQTFGQLLAGQWKIAVPATLRDPNTNKNLLSLRFGNQNRPIGYQDRRAFNQNYLNIGHSTVVSQATASATSIVLTSTHDLDSSGALTVANNAFGDGLISISYTGNNKATNTLTGIPVSGTGSITRTILAATDVWQRGVFGFPTAYTIDAGYLYFNTPLSTQFDGQDVKGDFYRTIPVIDTDADLFDEPFYDLYVSWLKFRIKYLKANGKIDRDGDTDYKDWMTGLNNLIGQETPGQRMNFVPDVDGFLSATE